MLEHFFKSQSMQAVREGPHGPLLEGFARELCQVGYNDVTVRRRFGAAKHLVHWMGRKRVPVSDLTEDLIKRFGQHLAGVRVLVLLSNRTCLQARDYF
jgi:hypothetical protein